MYLIDNQLQLYFFFFSVFLTFVYQTRDGKTVLASESINSWSGPFLLFESSLTSFHPCNLSCPLFTGEIQTTALL